LELFLYKDTKEEGITALHSHARRDEDFRVHFECIPDSSGFGFRPEPGKRPVMAGIFLRLLFL